MTVIEPAHTRIRPPRIEPEPGSRISGWLSSTDHKVIGHLYLVASFSFFIIGGLMAMFMRTCCRSSPSPVS